MKKSFLLLILLYSISFFISAQKDESTYEIGHYFDVNGNLIEGYFDRSYSPNTPISISYSVNNTYTVGRYYDIDLNRIDGYIELSGNTSFFNFKSSKNTEEQKVSAENCTALVVGTDSFVVVKNVIFQGNMGAFTVDKPHFASVLDSYGPYSFYELYSTDLNKTISTYYYSKRGHEQWVSLPITKTDFIETASFAFKAFPALVKKIKDYEYTRSDVPSLLKMLKYYLYYKDGAVIPFDKNWNEIGFDEEPTFYAEIISVNDDAQFQLKYYFNSDSTLISEAHLSNLYPNKYIDTTTYYYPNGVKRKEILFKKGKAYRSISYHKNGNLHKIAEIGNSDPYFENVYDINGNSILDKRGSGTEVYYDSIRNLSITYIYNGKDLIEAFYIEEGEKVYQYCYSNATIKNMKYFVKVLNEEISYSDRLLKDNVHGLVLLKVIVETNREFSDIKVLKGLQNNIDESLISFMNSKNSSKLFKSGFTYKKRITQEIVLPISFNINGFSYYKNNHYYDPYFMHQQQMMWMQQNTINNIPTISY